MRFSSTERSKLCACLLALLFLAGCQSQPHLRVIAQDITPTLVTAAEDLAARIGQAGYATEVATGPEANAAQVNAVILTVDESAPDLQPEGFRILPIHAGGFYLFQIIGKDQRGVLWGSQELADQILSSGRLETIFAQTTNRRLPLRAIALPLILPEASAPLDAAPDLRAQWREQIDLLSRSRFNAIFLHTSEPLLRFVPIPGDVGPREPVSTEVRAYADWLRELIAVARDFGLECFLSITPASLEGWPIATPGQQFAPVTRSPLAGALPAIFGSYPELGGVALDPGMTPSGDPIERNRWLADNILAPLADSDDRRPVILGVGDHAWPVRDELSALAPDGRIQLLAQLPPASEPLPESDYPILWRLELPPSELRPWDDPSAMAAVFGRIGARDSLGFLDATWISESPSEVASSEPGPDFSEDWFRLLLLGRMGYSPDVPEQSWVQQFVHRIGSRAGSHVYAAASLSNSILKQLPGRGPLPVPPSEEPPASDASELAAADSSNNPSGVPSDDHSDDPIQLFRLLHSFLMEQDPGVPPAGVFPEVLRDQDRLLPGQTVPEAGSATAVALENAAREALDQADEARRLGAWRDPSNERLLHRIQTAADAGFAIGDRRRAALALARFLLGGQDADRQQALALLQSVQEKIAAESSPDRPRLLAPLQRETAAILDAIPGLVPWKWEKTVWEVGTAEAVDYLTEMPLPLEWTNAETTSLHAFGLFGLHPWMSSINQQLRSSFLKPAAGSLFGPDGRFVARTLISIPSSGQLVLRLLSDQPATIWINGAPAMPLSPAQFAWPVGSPPPSPLQDQLLAQTVPPGDTEVIVSVPATGAERPMIALASTFAARARVPMQINSAEGTPVGGVTFIQPSGNSIQPYLASVLPPDGRPAADAQAQADFSFALRDPGFYRLRLWAYWDAPPLAGLSLSLDGSLFAHAVGKDDPAIGSWHWVPLDLVAALGPGEHRLRIKGWSAGMRVGFVEVSQPDALLPGS